MKKGFFLMVITLLANIVFSQEIVDTPEGYFAAWIEYKGLNKGQFFADMESQIDGTVSVKLTNGQINLVRRMLNKYNSSRGTHI